MVDVEVEVRIVGGSFTTATLFALYCEKWTLTMLRLGVSEVKQADKPMKISRLGISHSPTASVRL